MKHYLRIGILVAALLPFAASAQTPDLNPIISFVQSIGRIFELILPILVTLAVIYFFWGLAQYIFNSGDEAAKASGKNKMIWGVIALFVMVSIWGIVGFLGNLLGIDQGGATEVPGVEDKEDTGAPSKL